MIRLSSRSHLSFCSCCGRERQHTRPVTSTWWDRLRGSPATHGISANPPACPPALGPIVSNSSPHRVALCDPVEPWKTCMIDSYWNEAPCGSNMHGSAVQATYCRVPQWKMETTLQIHPDIDNCNCNENAELQLTSHFLSRKFCIYKFCVCVRVCVLEHLLNAVLSYFSISVFFLLEHSTVAPKYPASYYLLHVRVLVCGHGLTLTNMSSSVLRRFCSVSNSIWHVWQTYR